MGQQYSFAVKVLQDHALVLKDLAVLNQESLSCEHCFICCTFSSKVRLDSSLHKNRFD